jgi:hypothetical protein
MRDRKFSRRVSVPQTTTLAPLPFANRTITSVACSAFLAITLPKRGQQHRQRNAGGIKCVLDPNPTPFIHT